MLTYTFDETISKPIYEQLYEFIKADIIKGNLVTGDHLPSKRTFASHLGVSTITVENSYGQLMSEGYIYSECKRGYFVAEIPENTRFKPINRDYFIGNSSVVVPKEDIEYKEDLSSNRTNVESFPFSIWAKLMRETISEYSEQLLKNSPSAGIYELRKAIAMHLNSFRGMQVLPDQIIVGAGTEYLYSLLIQLLGRDKTYCVENPGYRKIEQIYKSNGVNVVYAHMDMQGITAEGLLKKKADIAHISPTHHYPTGITMPVSRRYELLAWANGSDKRFIIEDDYDSEFRLTGKPIPSLQSIDVSDKVIYMNTFSKSLASTIRISYMILPVNLANIYYKNMSFYSCTVSNFEQYTLARFISEGYFEKQINRMRLYYSRQRKNVLSAIRKSSLNDKCEIIEQDSGLHFLIRLHTDKSDETLINELKDKGINIRALGEYFHNPPKDASHTFIMNYSNLNTDRLLQTLEEIESCL